MGPGGVIAGDNGGGYDRRAAVEWPTLALAFAIYLGWLAVTWWHASLPWWIFLPVCTWLVAWQSSLQHEILHGHPTKWRAFNRCLATPPLGLWLPYEAYRVSHLRHHADDRLTDPLDDPESRYLTPQDWAQLGRVGRALLDAQKTLLGRIAIGPFWAIATFLVEQAGDVAAGVPGARRLWALHALWSILVAVWLAGVCGIDFFFYVYGVVFPAASLMLTRSFAEHKAVEAVGERTAIVENAWILGPLYLFNNLHAVHHDMPSMPWYRIPGWYGAHRADIVRVNGGMVYNSYFDVARRFLFTAHDAVAHPLGGVPHVKKAAA